MNKLIYLALTDDSVVKAIFLNSVDASRFCMQNNLCLVPFNEENKMQTPAPKVGDKHVV